MRKEGKWYKKILCFALPLALVVVIGTLVYRSFAAENIQKDIIEGCPTIEEAIQNGQYDNGIVFHGLYLIDIHAISEDVFSKANNTAKATGQSRMFYCSELSAGSWYEIDDYSRLTSITPLGESIKLDEVAQSSPYVKYYIDKKGLVHDLTKTAGPVESLYNEPDPYNKYLLDEFSDLLEYTKSEECDSRTGEKIIKFYDNWPKDDYTDYRDSFIENAQIVKKALVATGDEQDEELSKMMETAEKVADADRRYHYFNNIETIPFVLDSNCVYDKQSFSANEQYYGGFEYLEELRGDLVLNEKEFSLVRDTETRVTDSKVNYSDELILEPDENGTILDKEYYQSYVALMEAVVTNPNNESTIKPLIKRFYFLHNIKTEVVKYPKEELQIIDELMPLITDKYIGVLSKGVTPHYNTALSQDESTSKIESILYKQLDEVELVRNEIQFMISARLLRMDDEDEEKSTDEKEDYIIERIKITCDFYYKVIDDVFADYANTSISLHIEWLKAMLSTVDMEDAICEDEQEENERAKEALEEYEDAVENGDINEINRLAVLVNYYGGTDTIKKMSDEKKIENNGKESLKKLLDEIKGKAIKDITEKKPTAGSLIALVVLDDSASLSEIESDFGDDDFFKKGVEDASRAINSEKRSKHFSDIVAEDKKNITDGDDDNGKDDADKSKYGDDNFKADDNTSERDISGDKEDGLSEDESEELKKLTDRDKAKSLSEDDISKIIEKNLGSSFDNLSADGKIIAAVATGELGDAGYAPARAISERIMSACVSENNKYAYKTAIVDGDEFVSLRTIDKISDFRYAYDDKQNRITMENVGSGNAFVYALGSNRVQITDGKTESLDALPIKANGYIYVVETDTIKRYGVSAEPVTQTGYSGALTKEMVSIKNALVKDLVDATKELNEGNEEQ